MKYNEFRRKMRRYPLFSSSMLVSLTDQVGTLRVQLAGWKKKGLIRPLRKGLYVLNDEDRQVEPSRFYLANQIYLPSYVSLESALAYHGMIPEFVAATTSITPRKTCRFENEFGIFIYQHLLPAGYGGFESISAAGGLSILVATPEKAVVDFLYLNLSRLSAMEGAVFKESYRFQNCEGLDPQKVRACAERFGSQRLISVVRRWIQEVLR